MSSAVWLFLCVDFTPAVCVAWCRLHTVPAFWFVLVLRCMEVYSVRSYVTKECGGGGGSFFLACEDFGENVQQFIPPCVFFFFF